jgi:hypothetical protein
MRRDDMKGELSMQWSILIMLRSLGSSSKGDEDELLGVLEDSSESEASGSSPMPADDE